MTDIDCDRECRVVFENIDGQRLAYCDCCEEYKFHAGFVELFAIEDLTCGSLRIGGGTKALHDLYLYKCKSCGCIHSSQAKLR